MKNEEGQRLYLQSLNTEYWDRTFEKMKVPLKERTVRYMLDMSKNNKNSDEATSLIEEKWASGGRVLFWSDQHFGHEKIIQYAERPFNTVEEMNRHMLEEYAKVVSQDDIVVFGGDVSFGNDELAKKSILSLPGFKILVLGNHDINKNGVFREHGCDLVIMSMSLKISEDVSALVTHVPMARSLIPKGVINLHGHTHNSGAGMGKVNMSVEMTDYRPIDIRPRILEEYAKVVL